MFTMKFLVRDWSNYERIQAARENNIFSSRKLEVKGCTISTFTRKTEKVANIIIQKYLYDILKAPMNNKPNSALLSKQATNMSFSNNTELVGKNLVKRHGYEYVLVNTVGFDKRQVKIHGMFPELLDLMESVQMSVGKNHEKFNMVSIKIYYKCHNPQTNKNHVKDLNFHTDVKCHCCDDVYDENVPVEEDNNQCWLISDSGNYQPGRVLEWVHFN